MNEYLTRFDTMTLDLYFDIERATFVWKWASPDRSKAAVGEYKLSDMQGNNPSV